MRRIAAILTLWLWFCAVSLAAPPVDVLRITPGTRGFVRVILRVESHDGTRNVCLVWYPEDMEEFPSSSCRDVEGSTAPVIYTYEKTLPHGGLWYFRGVVERNTGMVKSIPKPAYIGGR